ncbi:MAG: rhodanese-like domain-containing protein [bacterium]
MRLLISFLLLSLLGAVAQSGCNSAEQKNKSGPIATASPAVPAPNDGVRRVTTTELQDLLAKHEAFVVDVRNEASYNAGHIRSAKLIPEADIPNRLGELPKDKLIVTYCS